MAGNEILSLLEYLEQERGIERDKLVEALEKALISAGRKSLNYGIDIEVKVSKNTGEIRAWVELEVVKEKPDNKQIIIEDAKLIKPDVKLGEIIIKKIPQKEFGRIAAQTAKQTMLQQLKKAEKSKIYDDYKDSIGQIISGKVRGFEDGNIIVDFQRVEGFLSVREKIPGDKFMIGDRINALLKEINTAGTGANLILSRTSKKFIRRLFEREIAEISDGIVEIKGVARIPGARTKIAVLSHDPKVDSIGACIGIRGSRIRNITSELSGERIDIVEYDNDIYKFVKNAMQPAVPKDIEIDEEESLAKVIVDKDQIRLAIGKNWQNTKLCSQLIGMKVKILTAEEDMSFAEKIKETISGLAEKLEIEEVTAEELVNNGILTVDGLTAMGKDDLEALKIPEEDKKKLLNKV
ncbi:MAG: transcription termination factor NusA [Victivallales bacterium]|nr:transcription termination factor NusA [Victivallales bacterium]